MVAYLCTYISMAFAFYGIVGYLAVRHVDNLDWSHHVPGLESVL